MRGNYWDLREIYMHIEMIWIPVYGYLYIYWIERERERVQTALFSFRCVPLYVPTNDYREMKEGEWQHKRMKYQTRNWHHDRVTHCIWGIKFAIPRVPSWSARERDTFHFRHRWENPYYPPPPSLLSSKIILPMLFASIIRKYLFPLSLSIKNLPQNFANLFF